MNSPSIASRNLIMALAIVAPSMSCSESEPVVEAEPSSMPPYVEPELGGETVEASFSLDIDTAHVDLEERTTLEPIASPVTVAGGSDRLSIQGFVRRVAARPDVVWVEVFVANAGTQAIRDLELVLSSPTNSAVYDFTNDPYSTDGAIDRVRVGNLGPEGMGRVVLGLPNDGSVHRLSLAANGTTTSRRAHSSAPLVMTPDGAEVWAVVPDANVVTVVDTASDTVVGTLETGARPSSITLTPDGMFAAVACADSNEVYIFDVASRELRQTFTEEDGIGRDPRQILAASDGSRFYVSAFVGATITEITRTEAGFFVDRTVDVGPKPLGMGISLDGSTLSVAHLLPRGRVTENEAWVSVIDTDGFKLAREAILPDEFNIDAAECLTTIFPVSASRLTSEAIPTQLAGIFFPPSGNQAWIPGTQVGPIAVWETGENAAELDVTAVIRPAEFLTSFFYILDARSAPDVEPMLHPGVLEPPDYNLDYIECARPILSMESLPRDVLMIDDNAYVNRGVATPTALAGTNDTGVSRFIGFSRGARRVLSLSFHSDELVVTDAMTMHGTAQEPLLLSGSNPTGLVVSPDGSRVYVSYENSLYLSVIDSSALAQPGALPEPSYLRYEYADLEEFPSPPTPFTSQRVVRYIDDTPAFAPLEEVAQIALVQNDPMDPVLRRGRILFESANPKKVPISASKIGACGGCHPMGGLTDGSVWGTMEGERRTMILTGGLAGRGWLHASGTHQDIDEFIDVVVAERLAGTLDAADHEALAQYLAVGIPTLQAEPTDPELAARGEELFGVHCTGCHQGERLTSGAPDDSEWGEGLPSGPLLYDVGTRTDTAYALLGTFFQSILPETDAMLLEQIRGDRDLGPNDWVQQTLDFRPRPERAAGMLKAPTLTNVSHNVLFFHDGRFDNLPDVVRYFDQRFEFGLSDADIDAIVEYLKTL